MAPSNLKGIIEELVNIDQRLSALEAKFDSFSNEQKDSERDSPRGTMQRRVCAVCSAKFACPASFRGQAPTCRGCQPSTHAPAHAGSAPQNGASSNKRNKPARKNERECTYCKKAGKWFQGHEESECHHKKKDEAEAALQAIKEKRERTGKGRQATQSEKKAFAAGALVKGPAAARRLVRVAAGDDEYPKSLPASSPHAIAFSAAAVLDQRHVRHGTVDTAAQLHVCRGTHGKGQPILLKGITGDTVNAERADVAFPVTTIEGKRYAIFMRNQTLVVDKETETLLSVAVLLKAGFDVKFMTGTKKDPTFGGYLVTPDGQKIRMIFGDNLWRLPMWSDPVRYINDETSPVNRNTLALVPPAAALEALAQPSLPDQEAMQLVHDMWCHPGNDKMEQIFKARRGRGFPRGFITKLRKFHCATCAVSKRTRRYRRSKRVKVAAAKRVKAAAAKRAPQAHTVRERTSEQEAQKQDSGTAIKQLTCQGCQRESVVYWYSI